MLSVEYSAMANSSLDLEPGQPWLCSLIFPLTDEVGAARSDRQQDWPGWSELTIWPREHRTHQITFHQLIIRRSERWERNYNVRSRTQFESKFPSSGGCWLAEIPDQTAVTLSPADGGGWQSWYLSSFICNLDSHLTLVTLISHFN